MRAMETELRNSLSQRMLYSLPNSPLYDEAKKFSQMVESHFKDLPQLETSGIFTEDTKVVILSDYFLTVASYKKRENTSKDHKVSIDLLFESIPYSKVTSLTRHYGNPSLTDEKLLISALTINFSGDSVLVAPIEEIEDNPSEARWIEATGLGHKIDVRTYLEEFAFRLETKIK